MKLTSEDDLLQEIVTKKKIVWFARYWYSNCISGEVSKTAEAVELANALLCLAYDLGQFLEKLLSGLAGRSYLLFSCPCEPGAGYDLVGILCGKDNGFYVTLGKTVTYWDTIYKARTICGIKRE